MTRRIHPCTTCGKHPRTGARFCTRCGAAGAGAPLALEQHQLRLSVESAAVYETRPNLRAALVIIVIGAVAALWYAEPSQNSYKPPDAPVYTAPAAVQARAAELAPAPKYAFIPSAAPLISAPPSPIAPPTPARSISGWNCRINTVYVSGRPGSRSRILRVNYIVEHHQLGFNAKLVCEVQSSSTQLGRQILSFPIDVPPGDDPFSGREFVELPQGAASVLVSIQDTQSGLPLSGFTRVGISQ